MGQTATNSLRNSPETSSSFDQTLGVAATHFKLMWRERRMLWLAVAALLLASTSVATSSVRLFAQAQERHAVAEEEARLWNSQGVIDPHDAAHVGRSVPAPVRPLAAFDPGLSDFLGSSVFIEGHAQNPAQHRPIEGGTALSRFTGFSSAWTLQVVVPLLIILAGFATMAGEVARARLRQELGAGASAFALVGGRLLALAISAGLLTVIMCGVSLPGILLQDVGWSEVAGLTAITVAYTIYLLAFSALTVAISGLFASARTALVLLLGFWAISTLLMPRVAPAVAETLEPTPSAPAFRQAVTQEAQNGVSGHDSSDRRLDAIKKIYSSAMGSIRSRTCQLTSGAWRSSSARIIPQRAIIDILSGFTVFIANKRLSNACSPSYHRLWLYNLGHGPLRAQTLVLIWRTCVG